MGENEELCKMFLFTQAGPDGEITAEEQVQMLLNAKVQCLHIVSTDDLAGKKKNTFFLDLLNLILRPFWTHIKVQTVMCFGMLLVVAGLKLATNTQICLLANPCGKSGK